MGRCRCAIMMILEVDNLTSTGTTWLNTKLRQSWIVQWKTVPEKGGAKIALGKTATDRYLRVAYVPDPIPNSVFVITAYELGPKAKRALRRRRKRAQ